MPRLCSPLVLSLPCCGVPVPVSCEVKGGACLAVAPPPALPQQHASPSTPSSTLLWCALSDRARETLHDVMRACVPCASEGAARVFVACVVCCLMSRVWSLSQPHAHHATSSVSPAQENCRSGFAVCCVVPSDLLGVGVDVHGAPKQCVRYMTGRPTPASKGVCAARVLLSFVVRCSFARASRRPHRSSSSSSG